MVALDALCVLRSQRGSRSVPAQEFFTGLLTTALTPDELLTEIRIAPRPAGAGAAFLEVARRHGDFALVGVAVELRLDESGVCRSARIALLSVGEGPVLATAAMAVLAGNPTTAARIAEAARVAGQRDIDPPSDIHATAAYRRHLASVLVGRALTRAAERAARPAAAP
jgi:carbon-monoxide dehydrogenase medium subunit